MIPIKGFQKTSLIDYAPYTASTIFLAGCNFRCPFCHNPDLVLNSKDIKDIPEQEIFDYILSKKKWIDAVCITGGEPTIYPDLPDFILKFKSVGIKIKLDTNGSNPEMIEELLAKNLVDFIAMDIKADIQNYEKLCNVPVMIQNIEKSIDLIKNSDIDYEFRTTVVPNLVGKKEILSIGSWLKGSRKFAIQNFRPSKSLIDNNLKQLSPYSHQELNEMKESVKQFFDEVEIRN